MVKEYKPEKNIVEEKEEGVVNTLSLSQYLDNIGNVIQVNCGYPQWVRCEIVNINKSSGHYYIEISDSSTGKKIKGQTAIIFSSKVFKILDRFHNHTKMHLKSGMNVLFLLKVNFNPNFGMSFIVEGIDPSYTIGEIERKNNLIKEELIQRGWDKLNKQKMLPFHFKKIAVLSPKGAAGLGDFKSEADKMMESGLCNFDYYDAKFEGNDVVESITKAMEKIYNKGKCDYDALVFIRGGGSTSSLQSLNEFKIVSYVAKYPIPVIVGVGHERDYVLVDDYARVKLDTPSKVAEYLFNYNYQNISNFENNLKYSINQFGNWINNIENGIQSNYNQIEHLSLGRIDQIKMNMQQNLEYFNQYFDNLLDSEDLKMKNNIQYVTVSLGNVIQGIEDNLKFNSQNIESGLQNYIVGFENNFKNICEFIENNSYKKVLQKGYAVIYQNGNIIVDSEQLNGSENIEIQFSDKKINL